MNAERAVGSLIESLKRPTSTPSFKDLDRDAYIGEQTKSLLDSMIEPVSVRAIACEWAQQNCNADNFEHELIAIAHQSDEWLLFIPESSHFTKAVGSLETQPLTLIHGTKLTSDDALAEWLG